MESSKLLIVDDDMRLAEALLTYLDKFDYETRHIARPSLALEEMKAFLPDLVILDIMMPEIDGLELCKEIRKVSEVPIIFLSARGETMDRIVGLELGADDFLPKPFEPRELVARIESVLRRKRPASPLSPLLLKEETMQAFLSGKRVDLTATEFQALNYLYKKRGKIVSRDELLTFLQGMDSEVYGRAIDILISRIRQKLGDNPKNSLWIKTVRSQGYRYIGGQSEEK